jgi:hypothetical protein
VNASYGQDKRREKPVDIGDGPARHDGEGALRASLEPCDYFACGCGNGDIVRALRQVCERTIEIQEDGRGFRLQSGVVKR